MNVLLPRERVESKFFQPTSLTPQNRVAPDVNQIEALINAGKAPLHSYINRANDTKGNARDSYLLSLDDLQLLKLFS